jgi:hypothetical protein
VSKHRLQIERRAADDLQHVGGRGLLLQRLLRGRASRLHLVEQAHVLDGDDGLIGEGLQHRNREQPSQIANLAYPRQIEASNAERLIAFSTSAVAVCCASDSSKSRVRACTSSNSRAFSIAMTA